jgi:uncharacterized membrane protein
MKLRLEGIDLLRTVAILIMLVANLSPYLENPPAAYAFRFICSLAAPLFVFLSGFVLNLTTKSNQTISMKWRNAFLLIFTAALIDFLIWKNKPFATFDILYLIGFSQLLNLCIRSFSFLGRCMLWIVVTLLYFSFMGMFEYRFLNGDVGLAYELELASFFELKRFLWDGWFPILPWFSYNLLGAIFGEIYLKQKNTSVLLIVGTIALLASLIFMSVYPISQEYRDGYVELFYPVGPLYFITSTSIVVTSVLWVTKLKGIFTVLNKLSLLGKHSLFVYIIHAFLISYVFKHSGFLNSTLPAWAAFLLFILMIYGLVFSLRQLKEKGYLDRIPSSIRQILGIN